MSQNKQDKIKALLNKRGSVATKNLRDIKDNSNIIKLNDESLIESFEEKEKKEKTKEKLSRPRTKSSYKEKKLQKSWYVMPVMYEALEEYLSERPDLNNHNQALDESLKNFIPKRILRKHNIL